MTRCVIIVCIGTNNEVHMITVRIIYKDGSDDIKDCWNINDICLDGVESIKIIRDERKAA